MSNRSLGRIHLIIDDSLLLDSAEGILEAEAGVPIVIVPTPLDKMRGAILYPPNAYESVTLFTLDKSLEQCVS